MPITALLLLGLLLHSIPAYSTTSVPSESTFSTTPFPPSIFTLPTASTSKFQSFNGNSLWDNFWSNLTNNAHNQTANNDGTFKFFFTVGAFPGHEIADGSKASTKVTIRHVNSTTSKPKTPKTRDSCLLPNATADKELKIICGKETSCRINKTDYVKTYTTLQIICSKGYAPGDGFQKKSICLPEGTWLPEIVPCKRVCPKLTPINIDITCTHNEEKVSCAKNLKAGTKVKPRCKPEYIQEYPEFESVTCRENGKWSSSLPSCTPVCGKSSASVLPLIAGGKSGGYGESPWNVAIYVKNNYDGVTWYDFLCSGTIITPHLVISASHCFYSDITDKIKTPSSYQIMVSKVSRNHSVIDNDQTKAYDIRNIFFPELSILGGRHQFQQNLALLEVERKISLSPVVVPACVLWNGGKSLAKGIPLKVSGWGQDTSSRSSETLQTANLSYLPREECTQKASEVIPNSSTWLLNYLGSDKLCAGDLKGPKIAPGDNGAGLLYQDPNNSLHYIQGVIGHRESLGTTSIVSFTNILFYVDWIKKVKEEVYLRREKNITVVEVTSESTENLGEDGEDGEIISATEQVTEAEVGNTSSTENIASRNTPNVSTLEGCVLPSRSIYNFDYNISCPEYVNNNRCSNTDGSITIPDYTIMYTSCHKGYIMDLNQQEEIVCVKGKWYPPAVPCKKICRKLRPENVNLKCTYKENNVDCQESLRAGTRVFPECIPQYRPEYTPDYVEIVCQNEGEWSAALFRCVPICGRAAATNVTALIQGGHTAKFGEFPWHIAIFEKPRNNTLICGGTIITQYVVLSAAHCFYDSTNGTKRNPAQYELAVGKITREYNFLDSEVTKFYKIKNIYFNNFHGILLRFQNDIAVLEMVEKIVFNSYVMPACMQYGKPSFVIPSGKMLKVAGWGIDESARPSAILKIIELPYLSTSECISRAPPELVDYFSSEKFCAGGEKGKSLETGDSGGGLFYLEPSTSFYYLQGIVSYKALTTSSIAAFTDVNQYSEWIRTVRDEIHNSRTEL